jgi:FkbM family methyltransferase
MQLLGQAISIPDSCRHVKIDVGMGMHNVQSIHWLKHEQDLFVFMFDPNMESVTSCIGHMSRMQDTIRANRNEICVIPVALADVSSACARPFYSMAQDGGTSSLFRPQDPSLGPVKALREVWTIPLSSLFEAFPWDRIPYIDYVKVDVQGADLEVLRSAGPWLAERVVYVTAEPEATAYEGCQGNTREAIEAYMVSQGFQSIDHPHTSDPTFVNRRYAEIAPQISIYQRT